MDEQKTVRTEASRDLGELYYKYNIPQFGTDKMKDFSISSLEWFLERIDSTVSPPRGLLDHNPSVSRQEWREWLERRVFKLKLLGLAEDEEPE